jgi:hypothetical protein
VLMMVWFMPYAPCSINAWSTRGGQEGKREQERARESERERGGSILNTFVKLQ